MATVQKLTVSRRLNSNSAFAKQVEAQTARKVAKTMESIKAEVSAEINKIVEQELVLDRPVERRKKGTRRLANSFYVDIVWDGKSFPISVQVKSRANSAKVAALEYGSRPHIIRARNAKNLVFPSTGWTGASTEIGAGQRIIRLESGGSVSGRQRRQAYGGRTLSAKGNLVQTPLIKTPEVLHPGNRPYRFMERGLEIALAKLKRKL